MTEPVIDDLDPADRLDHFMRRMLLAAVVGATVIAVSLVGVFTYLVIDSINGNADRADIKHGLCILVAVTGPEAQEAGRAQQGGFVGALAGNINGHTDEVHGITTTTAAPPATTSTTKFGPLEECKK